MSKSSSELYIKRTFKIPREYESEDNVFHTTLDKLLTLCLGVFNCKMGKDLALRVVTRCH